MSNLRTTISTYWNKLNETLFPRLEEALDAPLTELLLKLIAILDMVRIEDFVPDRRGYVGRPAKSRAAVARSFIAKAVYNIPTTDLLIDRLRSDKNLRLVCGFETCFQIPSKA